MEYTEELQETNNQFLAMIYDNAVLTKAAIVIIGCATLFFLAFALYKLIKRHWGSTYFILLCAAIIVWTVCSAFALFTESPETAAMLNELRFVGVIPLPALLCLHVRQQVSYKEENPAVVTVFFLVSAFLIFIVFRSLFFPQLFDALPALSGTPLYHLVFYAYAAVALIRAYLSCFSVFYQMPKRTRRSTQLMLLGVSSLAVLIIAYAVLNSQFFVHLYDNLLFEILLPLGTPVAFIVLIYPLYNALHIMPASDVIVTSREFVMGGLETTVLVLNLKKQILDWNRNDWETMFPLPKPLYKEPYEVYRNRVLNLASCRVSPHSEDIIIILFGDKEMHLLLRVHKAGTSKRVYGYVVEIADVTPVYSLLRFFEEIAYYDTLTGLHNRNAYFDHIAKNIKTENMPLLIFVGDVNYLKKLNDNHGHLLGDELLRTVADVITKAMPPGSFIARTGGDEFVMLTPLGHDEMAKKFVKDMITFSEEIHHEVFGSPSISWGYAIMTSEDQSFNEMYEKADNMMYEYKQKRHENRGRGYATGKLDEKEKGEESVGSVGS